MSRRFVHLKSAIQQGIGLLTLCVGTLYWNEPLVAHDGEEGHTHTNAQVMTTRSNAKILPPLPDAGEGFHFVIYGDRTGGVPEGLKVLEQAVVDTNLLDPDVVMTVGDLIQGYNQTPEWMQQMKEYKAIMNRLKMKWFPVAGNHDVYWRGPTSPPQGQHEGNYEAHFGPLWYAFEHKNCGFIVLYSDEGDAESNQKGFNVGKLQMMSPEQLQFLEKALAEYKDLDHVFCFLHHPRWIGGGYTGSNWDEVHSKLVKAGNVSAVFAGHIHHMRYDPKDGIEYFTLATTGGSLSAQIPEAGYLHHLNMVSVRKDKITVSAIPVGAVLDPSKFTQDFLDQIAAARSIRAIQTSSAVQLQFEGVTKSEVTVEISNPMKKTLSGTLSFDGNGGWSSSLDHRHFEIAGGSSQEIKFDLATIGQSENLQVPAVVLSPVVVGEDARIELPKVKTEIDLDLTQVPTNFFKGQVNRCLLVESDQAAIRVDAKYIKLPSGPFTLETWVKLKQQTGYKGIIAKTQSSEYAFFSDEGVPQFDVHLGGVYVSAKAETKLPLNTWVHLAGVYDGSEVKLFVDGKLVDQKKSTGSRRPNSLPLQIGADPDGNGRPTRSFVGWLDEVRLSSAAIYDADFEPQQRFEPGDSTVLLLHLDRQIGPFTLDHSSSAGKGVLGRNSKLVPRN